MKEVGKAVIVYGYKDYASSDAEKSGKNSGQCTGYAEQCDNLHKLNQIG